MFPPLLCVKVYVVDPRFVDDVQFICFMCTTVKIQINRLDDVQFRCSIAKTQIDKCTTVDS